MNDYIKLNRKILEWEWWSDINTYRLFTYMLLKANWKDGKFRGQVIKKGSFVSSIPQISIDTKLTEREVRTAISHLKTTGEVTVKTTNKYSIFTINNYCFYQECDTQNDRQKTGGRQTIDKLSTGKRHSNDILTTTIEEGKKERREENKKGRREEDYLTVSDDTVCQTDVRRAVESWNDLQRYGIKPISRLSKDSKRYRSLQARIRQYGIADIQKAIENIRQSDFLQGKNSRDWVITFDWFVLPNNFPKVLDGNYANREESSKGSVFDEWRNA